MKTGLFFASATGKMRRLVDQITEAWGESLEPRELADCHPEELLRHDCLLLGSPTYGIGQLHHHWPDFLQKMTSLDLSDKTVGLFAMGDGRYHGNTFVGALGLLYDQVERTGARIVGSCEYQGYRFQSTTSIREGVFPGLVVDWSSPGERRKTGDRIETWITQLKNPTRSTLK